MIWYFSKIPKSIINIANNKKTININYKAANKFIVISKA